MSMQEEMYNLITEYQSSGLWAMAFSEKKGISPSTFCYWMRKKKEQDHPGGFIAVVCNELKYPNDFSKPGSYQFLWTLR